MCRMLWFLLAIALSSVRAHADDVHPKPILEQETLHAIPGTFAEMRALADLVAKVRITHSEVEALTAAHSVRIHTVHHAQVLTVLKGTARAGDPITFCQVAGQLETKDAIVRVMDEEPLTPGDYIVFVRHAPGDASLHLIGDVDGAYKLVNGFIEPLGKFTGFAQQHRGMSEERFVREIEAVAARERKKR
jgi:hypothetical protein